MEKEKNLTEGNILKSLMGFALPVLLAMFLQALYGAVDLLIVGQFATTEDVSGVATGSMLLMTLTGVITGLAMGITILVGQSIGEKNAKKAGDTVVNGTVIFAVLAIALTIAVVVFSDVLSKLMHAPKEAFEQTVSYVRICGIGLIFIIAYNVLGGIFRGIGDSKTPLITVIIASIFNVVADVILVAVFDMGAAGAAIATVIAQGASVLISLFIISRKKLPFEIELSKQLINKGIIVKILKLGIPVALQELLVGISFLVIQAQVNTMDVIASAGVGVAEKLCGFIMLIPASYMQSMSAFVAQNIGAGRMDRAKKALLCGISTSLIAGVVIGGFSFFRGDLLAMIFTKETAVIVAAHDYMKAYAIDCLFTAFLFCFLGYFNGCGNTFFVMLQGIVGAFCVRVPLVLLIRGIENVSLFMIGLATPASTVVQIVMCVTYYCIKREKVKVDS
ncbi:MAG: MATE family efflux transporter [Lachnospira sp.]|nr:MATE family efflux transporter [Lachnospira sp.]